MDTQDQSLFDPFTDRQLEDYYLHRLFCAADSLVTSPHWTSSRKEQISHLCMEGLMLLSSRLRHEGRLSIDATNHFGIARGGGK